MSDKDVRDLIKAKCRLKGIMALAGGPYRTIDSACASISASRDDEAREMIKGVAGDVDTLLTEAKNVAGVLRQICDEWDQAREDGDE